MSLQEQESKLLDRVVKLRPDVLWSRFSGAGHPGAWVVRDPISLEYFYFSDVEKQAAGLLNGQQSLLETLQHLPGVSAQWLLSLVSRLESACLTVPQAPGQVGPALWRARAVSARRQRWQRLLSPLSLRFKLVDPTELLNVLAPLGRLVFSRLFVLVAGVFCLVIAGSVFMRWLYTPSDLLLGLHGVTFSSAAALVLIYVVVKSLHELGHALACRRWNAECHEIGLIFLVFTPCLYCDTSDSWKISRRLHRACIAAAGIYVELIVAAIAACVWLWTSPSTALHFLAANTMVVCSVSTVFVNANPLLRYDGYYVLSDVWGVPNLAEQSQEATRGLLVGWLLGESVERERWDASPASLAMFGVASWLYRQFVMCVIAWLIWTVLNNLGLGLVGAMLLLLTLGSLLLSYVASISKLIRELNERTGRVKRMRVLLLLSLIGVAVAAFIRLPLPSYAVARGYVTHQQLTPVYARQAGELVAFQPTGNFVQRGAMLASLDSPELRLREMELQGEIAALVTRAETLNLQAANNETVAARLATAEVQLSDAREQLQIVEQELASLVISADRSGVFLPSYAPPVTTLVESRSPGAATVEFLTSGNVGAAISKGDCLGWLGEPTKFEVVVLVEEYDAELIAEGSEVRCRFDCEANRLFVGEISRIAPEPIVELPPQLKGDRSIAAHVHSDGSTRPNNPHFSVTIQVAVPASVTHHGLATAHIATPKRTLLEKFSAYFNRNVRPTL